MNKWVATRLSEVVTLQRGYDLPGRVRGNGDVPVLGSFGITGYHDVEKFSGPGVSIGRSGASIGVATFTEGGYWPLNTTLFVKDFKGNCPRWVYYMLDSIDFAAYNSGSAQPSLNRNYLASIEVNLPPLAEQRAIAATLGALDDKIESNQRQRELLRTLGLSEYQTSMRNGERNLLLSEATISIARGIAPKYADHDPDAPLVVNQKCIRDGWVSLALARRMVDRSVKPEKRATSGDILVNSTGTGTLGRIAHWHTGEIYVDSHVTVVKPDLTVSSPTVLAYSLLGRESEVEDLATGSTGQTELSASRLGELHVRLPLADEVSRLEQLLGSIEERCEQLARENGRLQSTRDAISPELLSGRTRVPVEGIDL